MKTLLIVLVSFISLSSFCQKSDKEKAYELGSEAIQLMESGKIEESIELLEEARKLDPENMDYPYEIGYAHYLGQNYPATIKMVKPLLKHKDVYDRVYQMLGNAYDMNGEAEKAIKTYEKGLKKFPNSGTLHLERGNMAAGAGDFDTAMEYWEQGIEREPNFPSNYYWVTKVFMQTKNKMWGLLYGEIFINLEPTTNRTVEISQLMFDTYIDGITITSDTSMEVDLCENVIVLDKPKDVENLKLPYCMTYGTCMTLSLIAEDTLDINALNNIRTNFTSNYFSMDYAESHPNVLMDYRKQILDAGHHEAYNRFILMAGDPESFKQWIGENEEKWQSFVDYFNANPLRFTEDSRFHRKLY